MSAFLFRYVRNIRRDVGGTNDTQTPQERRYTSSVLSAIHFNQKLVESYLRLKSASPVNPQLW